MRSFCFLQFANLQAQTSIALAPSLSISICRRGTTGLRADREQQGVGLASSLRVTLNSVLGRRSPSADPRARELVSSTIGHQCVLHRHESSSPVPTRRRLTPSDKDFTLDDMGVMVRAAGLRGWATLVRDLGGEPGALLSGAGLAANALDDEDGLLPARAGMHLLEASAVALDCPDFGLRMANAQDPTALGPLALVLQNTPTVREMIETTSQYLFVHSPALRMGLHPAGREFPGHVSMQFDIVLDPRPPARQTWDLGLATAHRVFSLLVKSRYRPRAVLLPHSPLAPLSRYVQFFETNVYPERAHGALIMHEKVMDASLSDVDDTIRKIATSYLETHYSAPGDSTSALVRSALSRVIGTPQSTLEQIAQLLALHPRTLQRRLAAECASFEALRDEVAKNAAYQYITETSLPMSQIADAVGLSEQSALTRACKRWFGQTPTALRRQPH